MSGNFFTEIASIKEQALKELESVNNASDATLFDSKYLGRKGILRNLTAGIPQLAESERGQAGKLLNEVKNILTAKLDEKLQSVKNQIKEPEEKLDLSLPGEKKYIGYRHPVYTTLSEMCSIFSRLGFEICYGPEIENEYHNFTALNIPLNHASRDAFDTFYLSNQSVSEEGRWLLRSHTSPGQVRVMKNRKPPFSVIIPGKVFRPDTADASHLPMFHQVEGLMVAEGISFAHLKGILDIFCKEFFGPDTKMRFRPSFFPFTEPSAEVDITCQACKEKDESSKQTCPVCKGSGWLEVLGSGMVHPNVLENVGYDTEKYTGFAFGIGVDRMAMLKYKVNDIRLFTENHIGFLSQF
jgi:phenylalanyl-tRNA synthetase alpha chain